MSIQIIDGFKLNLSKPIDTRMVAANESVRNNIQYKYDGLRVFDLNDKKGYVWYDNTWNPDSSGGSGSISGTIGKIIKIDSSGTGLAESTIYESGGKISIGVGSSIDQNYTISVKGGIKTDGNLEATYLKGNGDNITNIKASNITDGKLALIRLTNGYPNQVLITNASNVPTWVEQNTLVVSNINVSNDASTSNQFITFVANSGSQALKLHNTGNNQLAYNPSNSQLLLTNLGSKNKPSYSFLNAIGTGMYGNSTGLGISENSIDRIKIERNVTYLYKPDGTNGISIDAVSIFFGPAGSNTYNPMIRPQNVISSLSTKPDYTWSRDDTTGIFHPSQGVVGISSSGSEVAIFTNTGLSVTGSISSSGSISSVAGTAASNPSYRFLGTTTGIYGSQLGLGISVNSVEKIYFNSNGDTTLISTNFKFNTDNVTTIATFDTNGIKIINGSAILPSIKFNGGTNTGIYYDNGLNISVNGIQTGIFDSTGLNVKGGLYSTNTFLEVSPVNYSDIQSSGGINVSGFGTYYDITGCSLTTPNNGISTKWLINFECSYQSSNNNNMGYAVFNMYTGTFTSPNNSNILRKEMAVGKTSIINGGGAILDTVLAVYIPIKISKIVTLPPNTTVKVNLRRANLNATLSSIYFYMVQIP